MLECWVWIWLCLQYFDGGDAWFTPLAKIAVDQTVFAATWNTLYYFMLGKQLTLCSDNSQSLRHKIRQELTYLASTSQ